MISLTLRLTSPRLLTVSSRPLTTWPSDSHGCGGISRRCGTGCMGDCRLGRQVLSLMRWIFRCARYKSRISVLGLAASAGPHGCALATRIRIFLSSDGLGGRFGFYYLSACALADRPDSNWALLPKFAMRVGQRRWCRGRATSTWRRTMGRAVSTAIVS
jgi:hypothetical protein